MEDKWKIWLKNLCGGRKIPPRNQLLILLLIGILLVVIALPAGRKSDTDVETAVNTEEAAKSDDRRQEELSDYRRELEEQVAATLEYVQGVGEAEVMLTLRTSGEKVIEKDLQSDSQTITEQDSEGGTRVTEETSSDRVSVYEQKEDGTQSPYVSKEITPEIEGIMIVAEGGDNPVVVKDVTEAIQALFGIEAHKIKIMKRTDT